MSARLLIVMLLGTLLGSPGLAESPPPARESRALSLTEAIVLARDQNYSLAASRLGLTSDEINAYIAAGVFDPTLTVGLSHGQTRRGGITFESQISGGSETESTDLTFSAIKPTRTGGSWRLEYRANRFDTSSASQSSDSDNETFSSNATLRYSHPLLEGSGKARAETPITSAKISTQISATSLERESLTLEQTVTVQYLAVLRAQRQLETARLSLGTTEALFLQSEAQVKAGVLAEFELTNAEGGLATRQEAVLLAEQGIADAEEALKTTLGIPIDQSIVLSDELNTDTIPKLDEAAVLALALEARPEMRILALRGDLSQLQLEDARDRLQNSLNLNASAGLQGEGLDYGSSLDDMENFSWSVGLEYMIPLGTDRRAKGQHRQAMLALEQLEIEVQDTTSQIEAAVSRALRDLEVAWQRLAITATGVKVAQKRLENEEKRLDLGLSTTNLVLDVEDDLADARRREIEAELTFAQAKAALLNALGLSQLAELPEVLDASTILPAPEEVTP